MISLLRHLTVTDNTSLSSTSPPVHSPNHALDPYTSPQIILTLKYEQKPYCRTAQLRKGDSNVRLCCLMQPTMLHAPIYPTEATKTCHKLHPTSCCILRHIWAAPGNSCGFSDSKGTATANRTPQLLVAFPTA